MSLTKASFSMIQGAVLNVLDFGADPNGVADSQPAIQAAVNAAVSGTDAATYAAPYKTVFIPSGVYKMQAPLVIPANTGSAMCAIVGEANAFHGPSLVQAHAGHMIVLGSSSQAASPRIENIVIQGNKTTYVGQYHGIYQTTTGSANTAFQTLRNVLVRDMGGVGIYMDYAFYCNFYDVTVAYNATGGMYLGGGSGNTLFVCTQNNLGYGIRIGVQGSLCQFFMEGDCVNNNPTGLNLSNYGLNVTGGSNRIGGSISTNVNNTKTDINIAGANNIFSLVIDNSLASPAVNFVSGANYNWFTGNIGNVPAMFTGDATAISTMFCQGPAGTFQPTTTGERIFTGGNNSSSSTVAGLHVGFDPTALVSFIKSTFPGTTNYPLFLNGSKVNVSAVASYATNAAALAGGLVSGDLYRNGDILQIVH
jgi:hypothetical protein